MLASIYSAFNFLWWSLSTSLWITWWLFILVAIITFIGFINVQFFPKNHLEYNKMIEDEQKLSARIRFLAPQRSLSSTFPSDQSDDELDDSDTIRDRDLYLRKTRSRIHTARNKQEIPESIAPTWKMSNRWKMNRLDDSPQSQSSPSDSHSISNVSASVSQYKGNKTFDDDSDHNSQRNVSSLLSPDIHHRQGTRFAFKLTPRMKKKRIQHHRTQSDSSTTNEYEASRDFVYSENDKIEVEMEGIQSMTKENKKSDMEFNVDKMQTFDHIYDYLHECIMNDVDINASNKCHIQECIEKGDIKLASFERALLLSKLLEV